MREQFIDKDFRKRSLAIIEQANKFINTYQRQGVKLTLRSLYYRFVAADLLENKQTEYKRLGSILNDARLAGLVDWDAFEDLTRNLEKPSVWSSPEAIMKAVADQYVEDWWVGQEVRVEVRIEKDAGLGVIIPVCEELQLPYFSCRGSVSQTEQYIAGKRYGRMIRQGLRPVILYLGDHDPSGLDMIRDNRDRLAMFARMGVEVRAIALTREQIEEYGPPPNPAKESDSRYEGYYEATGLTDSWELDALEPQVVSDLIREHVTELVDTETMDAAKRASEQNKERLQLISDRWDDIADFLDREED